MPTPRLGRGGSRRHLFTGAQTRVPKSETALPIWDSVGYAWAHCKRFWSSGGPCSFPSQVLATILAVQDYASAWQAVRGRCHRFVVRHEVARLSNYVGRRAI